MSEKRQKIIIFLLIANILIATFFGVKSLNKIRNLDAQLIEMYSMYRNAENNLNTLSSSIKYDIEQALILEDYIVEDFKYNYSSMNTQDATIKMDISVDLISNENVDTLILECKDTNGKLVLEKELMPKSKLNYHTTIELSYKSNYDFDVYTYNEETEVTKKVSESEHINSYDNFINQRVMTYGAEFSGNINNNELEISSVFSYNNMGNDDLEIDKVEMVFFDFIANKDLEVIDVTDFITDDIDHINDRDLYFDVKMQHEKICKGINNNLVSFDESYIEPLGFNEKINLSYYPKIKEILNGKTDFDTYLRIYFSDGIIYDEFHY